MRETNVVGPPNGVLVLRAWLRSGPKFLGSNGVRIFFIYEYTVVSKPSQKILHFTNCSHAQVSKFSMNVLRTQRDRHL